MRLNINSISQFCAELGKDQLLVQGAGGNVSWKDGNTLWVKGSGTWLANAEVENIFVPVDLEMLALSISKGNFCVTPEPIRVSKLRPSIETILHALMPQKIVIHLHAIYPLAFLVLRDAKTTFNKISGSLTWKSAFIEYFKPGSELAQAIDIVIKKEKGIRILFLRNHGIVLGGDSIREIHSMLESVLKACSAMLTSVPSESVGRLPDIPPRAVGKYQLFNDIGVQQLAQNVLFFDLLKSNWALYPDHVVFLGSRPFTYVSWEEFFMPHNGEQPSPDLIFIKSEGVFITKNFNLAKTAQLHCYYDVISRVVSATALNPLTESDIGTLLNWDAEKLRQRIAV